MTSVENLLPGPAETLLPAEPEVEAAIAEGIDPQQVAIQFPASSLAWAGAAEQAWQRQDFIVCYAMARTGYHRGLDSLRRNGWKGHGPIPWEHEPNRGFLRCLAQLSLAAAAIGEADEAARCQQFLRDSSATAAEELTQS